MDDSLVNNTQPNKSSKRAIAGLLTILLFSGLIATLVVLNSSSIPQSILNIYEAEESHFKSFMQTHGKSYANQEEYLYRFKIFKENLAYVNEMNQLDETNSNTLGVTKFMDMTTEEFKKQYLSSYIAQQPTNIITLEENNTWGPALDWRSQNAVTRVKDQGYCGSCWAFSAIGALESAYAIKHNQIIEFSEQQLVDCSYDNYGCDGGWMEYAFDYINQNGIATESEYPYTANDDKCQISRWKNFSKYAKGLTYANVPAKSVSQMKAALEQQPISVAVDASIWQFYRRGVLPGFLCGRYLNHGVLLVGYEGANWILKNSWGEDWGEDGYIRLRISNACGVLEEGLYPVLQQLSSES